MAIKTIFTGKLSEEELTKTELEAEIMRKLNHRNIICIKKIFTQEKPEKSLNIVMEFAECK